MFGTLIDVDGWSLLLVFLCIAAGNIAFAAHDACARLVPPEEAAMRRRLTALQRKGEEVRQHAVDRFIFQRPCIYEKRTSTQARVGAFLLALATSPSLPLALPLPPFVCFPCSFVVCLLVLSTW